MYVILLACIAFVLLAWRLILHFFVFPPSPLKRIPHVPGGLPLIGNALQMDSRRPHQTLLAWAEDLGPVFVFRVLGKSHVVLNDARVIYEALVRRGDDFAGRPYMYRADYSFCKCQNVAFQTMTPHWKILRKEVHRSVKQFGAGLDRLEKIALLSITEMMDEFETKCGTEFDPRRDIYECFTNIMCTLILGRRLSPEDPMLEQVIEMEQLYCEGFTGAGDGLLLDIIPLVRFIGNQSYKVLTKAVETRDKLWGRYIPELKKTLNPGKERGIADALLVAQEEIIDGKGQKVLNDDSVKMALTDVINGGTVTTSSTLYAFINILMHHPQVQRCMRTELDELGGNLISAVHKAELPYCRAVLLELLRVTTIGPLGLPHETLKNTTAGGYDIPAGTFVMVNLWAAHHDAKYWPEPWSFKPERFIDDNGDIVLPDHPTRKWFMPFGAGARVCLGESLALNRLFLAIVALVQRFYFQTTAQTTPWDPRTYEFGGILKPLSFQMTVTKWDDL